MNKGVRVEGFFQLIIGAIGALVVVGLADVVGGPMAIVMLGLFVAGRFWMKDDAHGLEPLIVAAVILVMAMERGFYWSIFPRGEGWWTANRTSALALFALAFFLPLGRALWDTRRADRPA
ncbi:MAG: hypothetical protein ACKVOB_11680 [Sphingomonas sp.]